MNIPKSDFILVADTLCNGNLPKDEFVEEIVEQTKFSTHQAQAVFEAYEQLDYHQWREMDGQSEEDWINFVNLHS